jgi:hypothetical protein
VVQRPLRHLFISKEGKRKLSIDKILKGKNSAVSGCG